MRLKNVPGSREFIAEHKRVIHDPEGSRGQIRNLFENPERPLHIEIGTGKGRFIMELARRNPGINYIGIEKYSSVLIRALQKWDALKEEERPENVMFIRMDAEDICKVFAEGEVDRIYLNFSDPWPKDRHAKRRLPSKEFLKRYEKILNIEGTVEFKTDNRDLFDFALEEIPAAGWELMGCTFDLHADEELMKNNVMTEYEEKFSSMGNPICRLVTSPGRK